jgi:hypothetical protein
LELIRFAVSAGMANPVLWSGQIQNRENNPMQSRMEPEKRLGIATQQDLVMLWATPATAS